MGITIHAAGVSSCLFLWEHSDFIRAEGASYGAGFCSGMEGLLSCRSGALELVAEVAEVVLANLHLEHFI